MKWRERLTEILMDNLFPILEILCVVLMHLLIVNGLSYLEVPPQNENPVIQQVLHDLHPSCRSSHTDLEITKWI